MGVVFITKGYISGNVCQTTNSAFYSVEDEVFAVVHAFENGGCSTTTVEETSPPAVSIIAEGQLRWNGAAPVDLVAFDARAGVGARLRMFAWNLGGASGRCRAIAIDRPMRKVWCGEGLWEKGAIAKRRSCRAIGIASVRGWCSI